MGRHPAQRRAPGARGREGQHPLRLGEPDPAPLQRGGGGGALRPLGGGRPARHHDQRRGGPRHRRPHRFARGRQGRRHRHLHAPPARRLHAGREDAHRRSGGLRPRRGPDAARSSGGAAAAEGTLGAAPRGPRSGRGPRQPGRVVRHRGGARLHHGRSRTPISDWRRSTWKPRPATRTRRPIRSCRSCGSWMPSTPRAR